MKREPPWEMYLISCWTFSTYSVHSSYGSKKRWALFTSSPSVSREENTSLVYDLPLNISTSMHLLGNWHLLHVFFVPCGVSRLTPQKYFLVEQTSQLQTERQFAILLVAQDGVIDYFFNNITSLQCGDNLLHGGASFLHKDVTVISGRFNYCSCFGHDGILQIRCNRRHE